MIVTEVAPAKVNLRLRVLDREPDGFHAIETLFCALELADEVQIRVEPGPRRIDLEVAGADLGPSRSNLAWRAASAFLDASGEDARVRIRLGKRIPVGGGLGGGSSDAAATLTALARALPQRVDAQRVAEIGTQLGSDVPFFLLPAGLAWGEGRGERLTPLDALPPRTVLLVMPPFPVSTVAAYRWLDESRARSEPGGQSMRRSSATVGPPDGEPTWGWVQDVAVNDFEPVVFARHGQLGRIRDALGGQGARPALLAGSGSTVFGVFEAEDDLEKARDAVARLDPGLRMAVTRTRSR